MADNHFDEIMVYDRLGTSVRIKPYGTAQVLDPLTDSPLTVVQNGASTTVITADANGRVSFVAQQGYVKLVNAGLVLNLTSPEAASSGATNAAAAQAAQQAAESAAAAAADDQAAAAASAASAGSAASTQASAAVAPLVDMQTQLMTVTPTIDELCFSFSPGTRSATPVWVAPFAGSIVWAAMVWQSYTVAASDTNYLTAALAKRTVADPATALDIVTKTSKVTGGEAVTAMKGWILNGGAWSTANATFAVGDVLSCRVDVTGTLSPLPGSPILTIRYKPYRAP